MVITVWSKQKWKPWSPNAHRRRRAESAPPSVSGRRLRGRGDAEPSWPVRVHRDSTVGDPAVLWRLKSGLRLERREAEPRDASSVMPATFAMPFSGTGIFWLKKPWLQKFVTCSIIIIYVLKIFSDFLANNFSARIFRPGFFGQFVLSFGKCFFYRMIGLGSPISGTWTYFVRLG